MTTSAFEYKCRRCEEMWNARCPESYGGLSVDIDGGILIDVSLPVNEGKFCAGSPVSALGIHSCDDNGHGISDLIGITPPSEEASDGQ